MNNKDIFIKSPSKPVSYKHIKDLIPEIHYTKPQKNKTKYTEWRLRIFDISNIKYAEISYHIPNHPRYFLFKNNSWKEYPFTFDHKPIRELYWYVNNPQ